MLSQTSFLFVISGFCHEINENSTLLGYFAVSSGNYPRISGPIGCPETSVRYYHFLLHNSPEEHSSHSGYFLFVPRYLDFNIFSMEMKL